MTEFLVLIRNVVLAMVLGWFGFEFAPDSTDKDENAGARAFISALAH
jgi:hypothetical protein